MIGGCIRCRRDSLGMPRGRHTRHWSSRRPLPSRYRYCVGRGHRWPRSSIGRASRANCSFGTGRHSYSHSRRRPRTLPSHIHWDPGKVAHSSVCRRFRWSRRSRFAARIDVRPRSPRRSCSPQHMPRWCKGRASNPPVGPPGTCPGRRTSGAHFPPSRSKRKRHTRFVPDRGYTSPTRRTGPCSRRWCDRWRCTPGRANPRGQRRSGPVIQSGYRTRKPHYTRRCSRRRPHRNRRNSRRRSGKPLRWRSCRTCWPRTAVKPHTRHWSCRWWRSGWCSDHSCRADRFGRSRPSTCRCHHR